MFIFEVMNKSKKIFCILKSKKIIMLKDTEVLYGKGKSAFFDTVYKVEIPAGTTIYKGSVGNQGGIYQGGLNNNQVFIQEPWLLDKVNVLGKQPLK